MLAITLALLPVTAFLLMLVLLDSFTLVSALTLIEALAAGAVAAFLAGALHMELLGSVVTETETLVRYVAPMTEEILKCVALLAVVRRRRAGFLVDSGILGFAVGSGFALVENVQYLRALVDASPWLWVARGFGTAILHGTTTAIVSIVIKGARERERAWWPIGAAVGLALAMLLHATFNRALVSPLVAAGFLMTVVPLTALLVFDRSERAIREWFGAGLDRDLALLHTLTSTDFGQSRVGHHLQELKARFPGAVVADMFCLLRLETELAIRAKGLLMARELGFEVPLDGLQARLAEARYLQRSIGPIGMLALRPLQPWKGREHWHRALLEAAHPNRERALKAGQT